MRRATLLAAVAVLVLAGCGGSKQSAKLAASPSKVVLTWTPPANAYGYIFTVDEARVSNTWNPSQSSVTFSKQSGTHTYEAKAIPPPVSVAASTQPPPVTTTTTVATTTVPSTGTTFFAQGGSGTGISCSSPRSTADFNNAATWGSGKPLATGSVAAICGTVTTALTFQGDGVTLSFQPGAGIIVPVCPSSGCVNTNGNISETISDGVIQATASGTGLANNPGITTGIEAWGCTGCTITGTSILGLYVHLPGGNVSGDSAGSLRGIDITGSNWSISNVTIRDAGWGIVSSEESGATNGTITNADISNVDHGWTVAWNGPGSRGTFTLADSHIHDYANWDTQNVYHHDGVHCFTYSSNGVAAHFTNLQFQNDTFDGNPGVSSTSQIFIEGGSGAGSTPCGDSTSIVTLTGSHLSASSGLSNGLIGMFSTSPRITGTSFVGPGSGLNVDLSSGVSGAVFQGNVDTDGGTLIWAAPGEFSAGGLANNTYARSGSNAFVCASQFLSTLTAWQSCIGGDTGSTYSP